MKLITEIFGEIEINDEEIIYFPQGVLGFEDMKKFVILDVPENPFLKWLQSVDEGSLAFLLTDPFKFFPDYEFELNDTYKELLAVTDAKDLMTFTTVTVPGDDITKVTANLLGPIVINLKNRQALQIVIGESKYSTKELLFNNQKQYSAEATQKEAVR